MTIAMSCWRQRLSSEPVRRPPPGWPSASQLRKTAICENEQNLPGRLCRPAVSTAVSTSNPTNNTPEYSTRSQIDGRLEKIMDHELAVWEEAPRKPRQRQDQVNPDVIAAQPLTTASHIERDRGSVAGAAFSQALCPTGAGWKGNQHGGVEISLHQADRR